jgi:hypothetical protein
LRIPFLKILKGGNRMPYIIVRCWYPDHLADQVAKKYLELMEKFTATIAENVALAKLTVTVSFRAA